jgi:hypothetical protein
VTEKSPDKAENEDAKKAMESEDAVKKDAAEDQKEGEKPKETPGKSG